VGSFTFLLTFNERLVISGEVYQIQAGLTPLENFMGLLDLLVGKDYFEKNLKLNRREAN
jgi:hypothetical protein